MKHDGPLISFITMFMMFGVFNHLELEILVLGTTIAMITLVVACCYKGSKD